MKKLYGQSCLILFPSILSWVLFIHFFYSTPIFMHIPIKIFSYKFEYSINLLQSDHGIKNDNLDKDPPPKPEVVLNSDLCYGQYIYIHNLPAQFHEDFLKNCQSYTNWPNMCDEFTTNLGLGPNLPDFYKLYSNSGWFGTSQFSLEVLFHNRMMNYKCLTNDSSLASAIYVPHYSGLDIARFLLWGSNTTMRDSTSLELVKWLREKPEWGKMYGRDHFMVSGRITWDFRRASEEESDWGNKLLNLPELRNMTMLLIESSPWNKNDFAIPYPTYFHPSSDQQLFDWQNRMREQRRRFLFSFAGASRTNLDSIRNEIIDQCKNSSKPYCWFLECSSEAKSCYEPVNLMKLFQSSVFCLQPPGDSYTRRSTFDSILAGCIPVFFHPASAYVQYIWHLPKDYTKYSVFIPASDVKDGKVSIKEMLLQIPERKVMEMREEVIRLIPRVVYANPKYRLETVEDAFDIAVREVIERVKRTRREMEGEEKSSFDFDEEVSWKYNLFATVEKHGWDSYFNRT